MWYMHARRLDSLDGARGCDGDAMVPPLDSRERALVVTAFISLPRNATKHGYQSLRHSLKVPADHYMFGRNLSDLKSERARVVFAGE